jgi:hypothetical protein
MEQGAFGGGATLDSVCVEQTRGRPSLDASGELPREVGCVEHACIHRDPARRKQVRRIAGEEDAVVAVGVRLFRGVAESRRSQRLAHREVNTKHTSHACAQLRRGHGRDVVVFDVLHLGGVNADGPTGGRACEDSMFGRRLAERDIARAGQASSPR